MVVKHVALSTILCVASFGAYLGYVGVEYGTLMTAMTLVQAGQAAGVFAVHDFLIPGTPGAIVEEDVSPELKAYKWLQLNVMRPMLTRTTSLQELRENGVYYTPIGEHEPQGTCGTEHPLHDGISTHMIQIASRHDNHVIEADVVLPEGVEALESAEAVLIVLHGGGHVLGNRYMEFGASGLFVHHLRSHKVAAVNMRQRLRPDFTAEQMKGDVTSVFHALLEDYGFDASRVFIYGCSAGANMAVLSALKLMEDGIKPGALILSSPADLASSFRSDEKRRGLIEMTREEIRCATLADVIDIFEVEKFPAIPENHYRSVLPNEFRQIAVSGIGEEVYELSYLHRNFDDFPPTRLVLGATDIFRDHGVAFGEKLKSIGVDVAVEIPPGLWHCPFMGNGIVPEARESLERAAEWLSKYID